MMNFQLLFKKIGYNSSLIEEYYTKLKALESGVSFGVHRADYEYKFPKITHQIKQKIEMVMWLDNISGGLSHGLLNRKQYPVWFNDKVQVKFSTSIDLSNPFLNFSGNFEDVVLKIQNSVGFLSDYRNKDIFFEIKLLKKSDDRLEFEFIISNKVSDKYLSMIAYSIAKYENIKIPKKDLSNAGYREILNLNQFLEEYKNNFSQQNQILVNKFKETNDLYYLIQIYPYSGWDNSNFI